MKLSLAILATAASLVSAKKGFKVNSKNGQKLMSKARKVEQDGDMDMDFMADMSLKFMGCHHISQWNGDADGDDEVRIESKRLAKFRLCPTDTCNSNSVNGCSSGYGDYIVSMDDFLASYLENKAEVQEQECENYKANGYCNCNEDDDGAENCFDQCFKDADMTYCLSENYYQADDAAAEKEEFEIENYLECTQYEFAEQRRRRLAREARKLEEGAEYYEEEEEEDQYYIGTYCSAQGGDVVLGVFTDEACTNFADSNGGRTTYYENEGEAMPYSEESIVDNECYTCQEEPEADGDDKYYEVEVKEICEDVYSVAGKCEQNMYDGSGNQNLNNNACQYIDGVKTTGSNGIINSGNRGGNAVASGFIGVFGAAFVVLGSYVYYLKTKLDRGRINLSD